jgi:nitrogen fixation/metabolism regulation signal transduction histidine kinase
VAGYAALSKLPKAQPREAEWSPVLARLAVLYPQARLSAKQGARGYFDAVQIEQALINLLKNANEAGGPLSEVALDRRRSSPPPALLQELEGFTDKSNVPRVATPRWLSS